MNDLGPGMVLLASVPAFLAKAVPLIVVGFWWGAIVAFSYGAVKIGWTRLSGKAFPVNKLTRTLDAVVELLPNLLGFVNKVLVLFRLPPILVPPVPDMLRRIGEAVGVPPVAAAGGSAVLVQPSGAVEVLPAPGASVHINPAESAEPESPPPASDVPAHRS